MRVILFRGKSEGNQWEYGNYCIAEKLDKSGVEYFIIDIDAEGSQHYVIPETVGQYTGLTDKNGKMIFEGDIVLQPVRETSKHSPCIIEFREGAFMAHYKSENRFFDRYYDVNSFTKVIGNITDNPELLKGE